MTNEGTGTPVTERTAAPVRRRLHFDRPPYAPRGRRSVLISFAVHVAVFLPLLAVVVLEHGAGDDVPPVNLTAPHTDTPEALTENEPYSDVADSPEREPFEPAEAPPEMTETVWFEEPPERGVIATRDPLAVSGLSVRFAPRRTRPGPEPGGDGNGDGAGEGAGEGQGAAPPPAPPREPVLRRAVKKSGRDPGPDDYPRTAWRRGWQGDVTVNLIVDASGKVKRVDLVNATRNCFVAPTERVLSEWRFEPATRDGRPIEGVYPQTVRWRID